MFKALEGLDNVAMYLRKSRADREAEARGEGETLSKHKKALLGFAMKYKINVTKIYEEIVSGEKIAYRPEMRQVLDDVESKKWNGILCMDLDRLGRGDMIDQGVIQDAFKQSKTLIITPRKVYDLNNELDEEWSEFESFMARRELKIITRRMQRGRLQSVRDGKFIGPLPPFGYDRDNENILIPNEHAPIVKMIFDWYVNGDENRNPMGANKIVTKLNGLGIPSPSGKIWFPKPLLDILRNEVYIGRIQWQKHITNKRNGNNVLKDRSEWIDVEGKHESIIDIEIFNVAQKKLSEKSAPRTRELKNPLAGLVVCGVCGYKMRMHEKGGQTHLPKEERLVMLKCAVSGCANMASKFDLVEEEILNGLEVYLKTLIIEQEKIDEAIKKGESPNLENPYPDLIYDTQKELDELHKQESELDTLLERKIYTVEKYAKRIKIISELIDEKTQALEQLKLADKDFLRKTEEIPKQIEIITNVLQNYRTVDIPTKNVLLRSVLIKAVYFRKKGSNKDDFQVPIVVKDLVDM